MRNYTILITNTGREVILEHKFLNDDFCEDAKQYYNQKNGKEMIYNSYFLIQAIHSFIVDLDIDPIYENQIYISSKNIGLLDIF